jgi:hypothetical protein
MGLDGEAVVAGCEAGYLVAAAVVGGGLRGALGRGSSGGCGGGWKGIGGDARLADGLAGFVKDEAGDGGVGDEAVEDVEGGSLFAEHDGGGELFVLVVSLGAVTGGGGAQGPTASGGQKQGEVAAVVGFGGVRLLAARASGTSGVTVVAGVAGGVVTKAGSDAAARDWGSGGGVDDGAGDAECGFALWRCASLRRLGRGRRGKTCDGEQGSEAAPSEGHG